MLTKQERQRYFVQFYYEQKVRSKNISYILYNIIISFISELFQDDSLSYNM